MSQSRKGLLLVMISGLTFGLMPRAVTFCYDQGANTTTMVVFRYMVIAVTLLPLMLKAPHWQQNFKRHWKKTFCLSVMSSATPIFLFQAYHYLPTSLATTLHFMYPTLVMLFCVLFFKDKLSGIKLLCLALCFGGILLTLDMTAQTISPFGIVLALCSSVTWATYIVLVDKFDFGDMPSEQMLCMVAMCDLILSGALYGTISGTLAVQMSPLGWIAVIVSNLFIGILGTTFFSIGVRYTEASTAAITSTLEPVTSILVGILFMAEPFTPRTILGMVMVLAAVIILAVKT